MLTSKDMITIIPRKYVVNANEPGWKDKPEMESGPVETLPTKAFNAVLDLLPAYWEKGWDSVTINSGEYIIAFNKGGQAFLRKKPK